MQPTEIRNFYEAAMTGLRFVDSQQATGRRFGDDADLRWGSFKGHLHDVDRIDLLIRDADAQWPGSMGARGVFNLGTVSEDDAFGKDWEPMSTVAGAELWRDALASPPPENLAAALTRIASSWSVTLAPFELDAIAPSTRLVVAGPSTRPQKM